MGRTREAPTSTRSDRMIDVANKQPAPVMPDGGGGGIKKSPTFRDHQKKHNAVNLPKNLIESDSDNFEQDGSSDDENDQFVQEGNLYFNGKERSPSADQVGLKFEQLSISNRDNIKEKLLRKLENLAKKYKNSPFIGIDTKHKDLKARSPYRNRLSEHKQKPFDRHDLTVTTPHGNGGRVFFHSLAPGMVEPVSVYPRDNMLLDAIQDKAFIESFIDLFSEEAEQVFHKLVEDEDEAQICGAAIDVPQPVRQLSRQPSLSPQSVGDGDLYDSSYETGSPASTVGTSPGSPSNARSSVSSESDQELEPVVERVIQPATNIVIIPASAMVGRTEAKSKVKPLGEVVNCISTSACQRLYELSKSTSFCVKHFTIQLVRVVMTTKAESASDRIDGFTKSLLSTMKTRVGTKPHEGDIWQLSVYAHIQFLTAQDRIYQYRSALKSEDERGHSLLYIAAVERFEKPLIARYIVESLTQVGYSPLELMDEDGNTILHVVAEQGDSHVHVLCELLMAVGPNNKPIFNVQMTNKMGQSPLHIVAKSTNLHLTTLLQLLRMGAHPLEQDQFQMTALHYFIQQMSTRPRKSEETQVVRKMVQAPMSLTKESLQILSQLRSDPSTPPDLSNVILEEMNRNCSKDLRFKKVERH